MKQAEAFGIVVRSVGLLTALYGLSLVWPLAGLLIPRVCIGNVPRALIWGIPTLIVGLVIMRLAPKVVSFAYPQKEQGTRT